MIVYHGSAVEVSIPDIYYSRDNVDFGKGFYVTPIKEQAIMWATRFKRKKGRGVVSSYDLNLEESECFRILEFERYTEEWLDFVVSCRRLENKTTYDIVAGGVANDRVFNTIELYFEGLIEKVEAIKRLQYEHPNHQICICNQNIIDQYMEFIGSEEI